MTTHLDIQRIAAFSHAGRGGNPAGVVLLDAPLPAPEMQRIAADVGYSETAFAVRPATSGLPWRVRYFSPESEVPFCGHATIALGVALGERHGPGTYALRLNETDITVQAVCGAMGVQATLTSPPTRSVLVTLEERAEAMKLMGIAENDLDQRLPPARIHAGADHLLFVLNDRERLAAMTYDLDTGRALMRRHGLVTIMLAHITQTRRFAVRNAFASGGVLEDPATGAAAAAFAGYLRDRGWPHEGSFVIDQGEDMGIPSRIDVALDDTPGAPVQVSGSARSLV